MKKRLRISKIHNTLNKVVTELVDGAVEEANLLKQEILRLEHHIWWLEEDRNYLFILQGACTNFTIDKKDLNENYGFSELKNIQSMSPRQVKRKELQVREKLINNQNKLIKIRGKISSVKLELKSLEDLRPFMELVPEK